MLWNKTFDAPVLLCDARNSLHPALIISSADDISIIQPKRVKCINSVILVSHHHFITKTMQFSLPFKVFEFSLGLCFNSQVKEKKAMEVVKSHSLWRLSTASVPVSP